TDSVEFSDTPGFRSTFSAAPTKDSQPPVNESEGSYTNSKWFTAWFLITCTRQPTKLTDAIDAAIRITTGCFTKSSLVSHREGGRRSRRCPRCTRRAPL